MALDQVTSMVLNRADTLGACLASLWAPGDLSPEGSTNMSSCHRKLLYCSGGALKLSAVHVHLCLPVLRC